VKIVFNSREYLIDDLTKAILDGLINDEIYVTAKQRADNIKATKEAQRKQATEKQRLKQLEALKPENAIPRLSKFEHVAENAREYHAYIEICDITLLEVYRDELIAGKHKAEFRNDAHRQRVLTFLTLKINQRKAGENPIMEKNRLLREAKVEREELKKTQQEITRKLQETAEAAQKLSADRPQQPPKPPRPEYAR
jgi:hypothetical protein